jgi:hypothetical protein
MMPEYANANNNALSRIRLVIALVAGVAIGGAALSAIRAQQVKAGPGYVIAELEVNDPTTFQKYGAAVPGTLAPFNGKYLVRGGKVTPLEVMLPRGGSW